MSRSGTRMQRHPAPQQWTLDDGINVVLFAGLGGACQGLEAAGLPIHVANNHDDVALAAHAALHPHTRHLRGDIFDVDPVQATWGRAVKVLWASPDCRDHSVAKGGAPRSARVRSLPWQVCRWAGKTKPLIIMMENVREIRGWGPLIAKRCKATGRVIKLDGSVALKGESVPVRNQQLVRDKSRMGRSYRRFRAHIEGLGYAFEARDICCADHGVPTTRRRWFAVARRDGYPIRWPARTHAPRGEAKALGLLPWVGAHTIIDWTLPMPSIFERRKPLAPATCRRVAVGMRRYVLDNPKPFLVTITHHGGDRVQDLSEPIKTITTAHRGEVALVGASLTKFQENSVGQALDEPIDTLMAGAPRFGVVAAHMVQIGYGEASGQSPRALDIETPLGTVVAGGRKHALVASFMAQHNTGVVGARADAPLSTLTTSGTQQNVVAGYLTELRGTSTARDATEPLPTLTAGGGHIGQVAAFMTKYYSSGDQWQECGDPVDTLTAHDRMGIVTCNIDGQPYAVSDIGMRMLKPHEAAAAHELTIPATITLDVPKKVRGQAVTTRVVRALTSTEITHLVGNSVPMRLPMLLAQCNAVPALYGPRLAEASEA